VIGFTILAYFLTSAHVAAHTLGFGPLLVSVVAPVMFLIMGRRPAIACDERR
jgi:hypothetical protein